MKLHLFSIHDQALQAYMPPWTAPARGVAHRMFQDELQNAQGNMSKHPDDYTLYHIGEYDDTNALITQNPDGPQLIVRGKDLQR